MWCPYYSTYPPCLPSVPPPHVFPPPLCAHPPPLLSIPPPILHSVPPLHPTPWPPHPSSTSQSLCSKLQTPIVYSVPPPPPLPPSLSTLLSSSDSKSSEVESVSSQLTQTKKLCNSSSNQDPHVKLHGESSESHKSSISSTPALSIPLPASQLSIVSSFDNSTQSPSTSAIDIESSSLASIETDIKHTLSSLPNSSVDIKCNIDSSIAVTSYAAKASPHPTSSSNGLPPVDSQSHTKFDEKIVDSADHALYIKKIEEFISKCKRKSKPCYNSKPKNKKLKSGANPSSDFACKCHENQSSSLGIKSKVKSRCSRCEDGNLAYFDLSTPSKDISDEEVLRTLVYLHGKQCRKYRKHPKRHPLYGSELKLWNEHMSSKGFSIHHKAVKTEWKVFFRNLVNALQAQKWEQTIKHFYSTRQLNAKLASSPLSIDKEENCQSSTLTVSSSSLFKNVSLKSPYEEEQNSTENKILNRERKLETDLLKNKKHAICKNMDENDHNTLSNSNKSVVKEEVTSRDKNRSPGCLNYIKCKYEPLESKPIQKINPSKNYIKEKEPIFKDLSSSIDKKEIKNVIEDLSENDCIKKVKPVTSNTDFMEEDLPLKINKSCEISWEIEPVDKREPSKSRNERADPIDFKIKASTSNIEHSISTLITERFAKGKNVSFDESRSSRFQNHIVIKCDEFLEPSCSGLGFDAPKRSNLESEPVLKISGDKVEFSPTFNKSEKEKVPHQAKNLTQNESMEQNDFIQKVPFPIINLTQNKSKEENYLVLDVPNQSEHLTQNGFVQEIPLLKRDFNQDEGKEKNDSVQKVPLHAKQLAQHKKSKEQNDSVLNVHFQTNHLTQNDSVKNVSLLIRELTHNEAKEKNDSVKKVPLQANHLAHNKGKEENNSVKKRLTQYKSNDKNDTVQSGVSSKCEFNEKIFPIFPKSLSECDFHEVYATVQKEVLSEIDKKKKLVQMARVSKDDCNKIAPQLKLHSLSSSCNKNYGVEQAVHPSENKFVKKIKTDPKVNLREIVHNGNDQHSYIRTTSKKDAKIECATERDESKRKYSKKIKTVQERYVYEDKYKLKTARKSPSKFKTRETAPIHKKEIVRTGSHTEFSQGIKKRESKFEALPKPEKQWSKAKDLVPHEAYNKPHKRIKGPQNIIEKNRKLCDLKYSNARKRKEVMDNKKNYCDQNKREFKNSIPKISHRTVKESKVENDKIKYKNIKITVENKETNRHCDKRINKINKYEQKDETRGMRNINRNKVEMERHKKSVKEIEKYRRKSKNLCETKEKENLVMKDDFLRKRKREN